MIIQRSQIVKALHNLWPSLVDGHSAGGHIWIPRGKNYAPTRKQFEAMVNAVWQPIVKHVDYDLDVFACTNFSATLSVAADFYVLQLQALNQLDPAVAAEWCVAEVWGTLFQGRKTSHAVSLVGLDIDGQLEFWFMEPQPQRRPDGSVDFRAWKADPETDKIHFFKL